jgi:hypothetical protein
VIVGIVGIVVVVVVVAVLVVVVVVVVVVVFVAVVVVAPDAAGFAADEVLQQEWQSGSELGAQLTASAH